MNEYSAIIHAKGWKIKDALNHWGISEDTWYRWRKQEKDINKLTDMINGLEDRNV